MFAHYLTGIYFILRIDEELTTILQFVNGIGKSRTTLHSNHGTIASTVNIPFIGLVFLEAVGHDGFSL